MAGFTVGGVATSSAAAKIQAAVHAHGWHSLWYRLYVISDSPEVIIFGVLTFDKAESHSYNQLVFLEYLWRQRPVLQLLKAVSAATLLMNKRFEEQIN